MGVDVGRVVGVGMSIGSVRVSTREVGGDQVDELHSRVICLSHHVECQAVEALAQGKAHLNAT